MKRLLFLFLVAAAAHADGPLSVSYDVHQYHPLAAAFKDGVLFVWHDATVIKAGVWKPGQPIGNPLTITGYSACTPAASGDEAAVFCTTDGSPKMTAFRLQGDSVTIARPAGSVWDARRTAAASNGSRFIVVWSGTQREIWRVTLDRDLNVVEPPAAITPPTDRFPTPTVVSNGDGFLIAWDQYWLLKCQYLCLVGGSEVMAIATDADGHAISEPLLLSRVGVQAAAASDGEEYVVGWGSFFGGGETLRRLTSAGVPLRGDVSADIPATVGALVAWSGGRYGALSTTMGVTALATFSRDLTPFGSTILPLPPVAAMVSFGDRLIAAYQSGPRIYVSTIDVNGRRRPTARCC